MHFNPSSPFPANVKFPLPVLNNKWIFFPVAAFYKHILKPLFKELEDSRSTFKRFL